MIKQNVLEAMPSHDGLCDEQGPIPMFSPVTLDEHGRIVMSEEERRARSAAALRALKAIAKIPDNEGDEQRLRDALMDLDAQRPYRPLFEGMY